MIEKYAIFFILFRIGFCIVCNVGSTCETLEEYDFVIIGSGAAGCVLADKLSKDGKHTVLVLEAGPLPDEFSHSLESNEWYTAATDPRIAWGFLSLPHAYLNGRNFVIHQGKVVGGCTSHNAQFWVFGNKHDWNTLEESYGAKGWNWDNIKPHKDWITEAVKPRISKPAGDGFGEALEAAARGDGWPIRKDYNNPEEGQLGWSNANHNSEFRDGKSYRKGAYQVFLKPALQRKNLRLSTGCLVSRVIFNEDKEVQYIEYYQNSKEPKLVRVLKEAIISAGALRTPQVLMLSGIGPEEHLKEYDIPIVVDLPGVGFNLQDHPMMVTSYKLKKPAPSDTDFWANHVAFGKFDGSWNETGWADWQIGCVTRKEYLPSFPILPGCERSDDDNIYCAVFVAILLHPFSKGYVRLISSSPFINPSFALNYCADPRDIEGLHRILKITRSLFNRPELSDWIDREIFPGISKSSESDEVVKATVNSVWHPVGTASIGRESDFWSVVDSRLRVKGVKKLRVADASVFPFLPSGNTQVPTLIVGSKAADLILEDNQ
jgi:choline dehydrogenase